MGRGREGTCGSDRPPFRERPKLGGARSSLALVILPLTAQRDGSGPLSSPFILRRRWVVDSC